jgi:hypothetical protein
MVVFFPDEIPRPAERDRWLRVPIGYRPQKSGWQTTEEKRVFSFTGLTIFAPD